MRYIKDGYSGLSLFLGLQMDRILAVGSIVVAMALAVYITGR